eukprot:CAMPEP_0180408976 /NCGR_PEP_ID=MMETSP0989-20121125/42556_1 /TAXON_ID=697907 /ORGANISM="non described non described, Strain CCMP2293" /LENGTH=83 /DNA_ID=CAMNT_0022412935 /DNA_START=59 /DNA_END=310 /DNA_ORIENTATION=-
MLKATSSSSGETVSDGNMHRSSSAETSRFANPVEESSAFMTPVCESPLFRTANSNASFHWGWLSSWITFERSRGLLGDLGQEA